MANKELQEASRSDPPVSGVAESPFYNSTRFWTLARRYGARDLVLTWSWLAGALAGGGITFLYTNHNLGVEGIEALAVAYVSLAAALFGIVLAGLAVVAAFFDPTYVTQLRKAGTLDLSLFGFWWVAAVAVLSLLVSIGLTAVTWAHAARGVEATAVGLATLLFVGALLESLSLVGTILRHGLYRAELTADPGAGGSEV